MTLFQGRLANREVRRQMKQESARLPVALQPVPYESWPQPHQASLVAVWRSRDFLLQVLNAPDGITRLSICRTAIDPKQGRWREDISWDDLQRLKRECGFGASDAVEVYPADADIVNVANMRHLWIMPAPLPFKWSKK